jgi:DNA-binding Xre family transcriptional regulator
MGMDEQLRRRLILFKEENRYSNQDIADMIKPCSGQSVGRWVVNKDSYISEENETKLRELLKDVNIGTQGIENTEKLRNVIFAKSMKKGLSFEGITNQMRKTIAPDELEILLSENGAEFTPKTLSSICAVLDIKKDDLPISEEDRDKLFIHAMKASMFLTEVPIYPLRLFNKTDNFDDIVKLFNNTQKSDELYMVAGLNNLDNKFIGIRYPFNNSVLSLQIDDILILTHKSYNNNDLIATKLDNTLQIGRYDEVDEMLIINETGGIPLVDHGPFGGQTSITSYTLKIVKIIRDLEG